MVFLLCVTDHVDVDCVVLDHGCAKISCVEPDFKAGWDESVDGLYPPSLDIYYCQFSASSNMVL